MIALPRKYMAFSASLPDPLSSRPVFCNISRNVTYRIHRGAAGYGATAQSASRFAHSLGCRPQHIAHLRQHLLSMAYTRNQGLKGHRSYDDEIARAADSWRSSGYLIEQKYPRRYCLLPMGCSSRNALQRLLAVPPDHEIATTDTGYIHLKNATRSLVYSRWHRPTFMRL